MYRRLSILIMFIVVMLHAGAQEVKDFTFFHLGTAEGVSSQRIYSVIQTGDGALWWSNKEGVRASIKLLNKHYLNSDVIIDDAKITTFINGLVAPGGPLTINAKEAINTQAWILHMNNPAEAWANLRRSDYPKLMDRTKLNKFTDDFTYDDSNLTTPVRLCYPILEKKYNSANYQEALDRMGGKDDWHHRVWWDTNDINVK